MNRKITFACSKTENKRLIFFIGEGSFTKDPIEEGFNIDNYYTVS